MSPTDFVDLVKEAGIHKYEFVLWPQRWQQYNSHIGCNWSTFPFCQDSVEKIPDEPGVYAFLIQPHIADELNASYLMYVGKTSRSLRQRFREYFREAKNPKRGRPKILRLLRLYTGYLYFSCSVVRQPDAPEELENELLKAFLPPANDHLPAEVSQVRRAF